MKHWRATGDMTRPVEVSEPAKDEWTFDTEAEAWTHLLSLRTLRANEARERFLRELSRELDLCATAQKCFAEWQKSRAEELQPEAEGT